MIEVKELSKVLYKNIILNEVSITAYEGKITGLRGVNGSGKTMLMRAIAGLIRPNFGTVCIDGKVIGKDISFPESLGFLIESPAFIDSYTGLGNLKLIAGIKSIVDEKVLKQTLERVGLDSQNKKKYRKYSLGMKQRLGIAAAIMERPSVMLLDEPTNALDSEGVSLVKKIVLEEKERGATIILSCHDQEFLTSVADTIYTMENGKVIKTEQKEVSGHA